MDNQLVKAGLIKNPENPDFFIINTCAVTAKAEREARQMILRLKRKNPRLKLVVTGCGATYWQKNQIWRNIPIDLIISNIDKEYLVSLIQKQFSSVSLRGVQRRSNPDDNKINDKFITSGRVMIKIQDGCHRFCTYCIVPYLRGAPKSRKINEIITDITSYNDYNPSIKEVVYTAINTESFGKDTGESLIDLIDVSIHRSNISRISFGSIHPWSIGNEFIEYYKSLSKNPRFSNFFHVPIQSGSNKILNLMKRGYKIEDVVEKVNQIQRINPLALIATDVIVGFLEETDKDFEDTYKLLESSPIHKFHMFRFSPRQNTAAYYLKKGLREPTPQEKMKRSKALGLLSKKKYELFLQKQVGQTGQGLFIGKVLDGYQQTILNNQIPVWVKTSKNRNGSMAHVKIEAFKENNLVGKISGPDRT